MKKKTATKWGFAMAQEAKQTAAVTVLGAGGFGTALAMQAHACGHRVSLWSHRTEEAQRLDREREQPKLLPGVRIPGEITITDDIACVRGSRLVILAVPSFAVRETCQRLCPYLDEGAVVACVSKGLEKGTFKDFSQVMTEELPHNANVVLSGPSHAEEVARGEATTVVAASYDRQASQLVQDLLMGPGFRIYVNDDVVGVELGGALKNIIAVCAGIGDGLGIGDNAKAALMTRGITEIARLGVAMGGHKETFGGLSGIGDLIVTCSSMHSRNRRFGILVGQGVPVEQALQQVGMVVEGYACTQTAHQLAQKMGVEMPITDQAYQVLYQGKSPADALRDLMGRPRRHESESIWLHQKNEQ